MEVIMIFRHLSAEEINKIKSLNLNEIEVLTLPAFVHDLPFKTKTINELLIGDAIKHLIDTIKQLGDRNIGNRNLSSILTVDKLPLWHYQRFRVFFLLRNEWIINHCIKAYSEQSEKLTCYVPYNFVLSKNVDQTGIAEESPVIHYPVKGSYTHKAKRNYKAILNYSIFFTLRVLISIFRNNHLKNKRFIVIDRSLRQQCRNVNTLKKKWDNFNLYTLFDSNLEGLLIISEVETPKIKSTKPFQLHPYYFNGEGRREKTLYSEWILFKGIINPAIWIKRKKLLNELNKTTDSIIDEYYKDEAFAGHSHHHTVSESLSEAEKRVFSTFLTLRKSSSFYIFKYLCYKQFFKNTSFQNISAIDENSPATRCILDAARSFSVKTIGIQHGNIGDAQPAYLYTEADKANHVMADTTIVWGEYFEKFLKEKSNYPDDAIVTTGQMRSDLIPAMLSHATEFKASISKGNYIVTFATQPIPDPDFRYKMAFDIFSCFKDQKDVTLIVKLHPAERHEVKYYKGIAKKAGYLNVDIRYDIDLYELLAASDLIITGYSTVGSEAVYFGKPLIIYDPFKEDLLNYVKEGVAFQATDHDSLDSYINRVKEGTLRVDQEKYQEFIRKYAYAIDGKCTERTIDIIRRTN